MAPVKPGHTILLTMRRTSRLLQLTLTGFGITGLLLAIVLPNVQADQAATPSLVISQLKITSSNGQFVTLYNATSAPLDMSKYQLEYFNSYDLAKATSSKLIALQGTLPPHSYYQVNDSSLLLCYRMTIDSQSLGFSSTAGYLGVLSLSQNGAGGSLTPTLQDYVSWSKTAASGAQTLPANTSAFFQRQPPNEEGNPIVDKVGAGSWLAVQPDSMNACNLVSFTANSQPVVTGMNQLLPSVEPDVSFVSVPAESDGVAAPTGVLPAGDIGLMSPIITELLPNPDGTGNDATDEYIELYNSNTTAFDLTGFTITTGLTASRSYTFLSGTMLTPHAYTAFYSEATSLSLSNTSGLAQLLDPFGNTINATGQYATAKDGQSWALAKGKWYYTTQATPNAQNVIKLPPATKKKAATTKSTKAKTTTKKLAVKSSAKPSAASSSYADEPSTAPIHTWVLALVVAAAVLYGAYEYRSDIALRFKQLRGNADTSKPDRG